MLELLNITLSFKEKFKNRELHFGGNTLKQEHRHMFVIFAEMQNIRGKYD